jgi:hypothetical protein
VRYFGQHRDLTHGLKNEFRHQTRVRHWFVLSLVSFTWKGITAIDHRTLTEANLDRVAGGLRDRLDQDRSNRRNRMDGGGWGAAIGRNLMMGVKMRMIQARLEIKYRFNLTDPRQGDRLRAVFLFGRLPPDGSGAGALF